MRHLTGASLTQNEEVKRISAWAAILFTPTLVGNIDGMNFDYMPELGWRYGYPLALLGMVATGVVLYLEFKHAAGCRNARTPRQRVCAASRRSCECYRIQRADCSSQVGGSPGNGWRSGDRKPSMITAS